MLSFFPRGVLDEILNLFETVSEGFPSYFPNPFNESTQEKKKKKIIAEKTFDDTEIRTPEKQLTVELQWLKHLWDHEN